MVGHRESLGLALGERLHECLGFAEFIAKDAQPLAIALGLLAGAHHRCNRLGTGRFREKKETDAQARSDWSLPPVFQHNAYALKNVNLHGRNVPSATPSVNIKNDR